MFASPTGEALNPNTDYHQWKRLLRDAGLREARLHDARHTAATVLLALRQPTPTVMSLMGWSSESMAARYQHVTDAMRTEVAGQVGDLIWQPESSGGDQATVIVRLESLAAVVAFAEERASRSGGREEAGSAELQAAIADLRTSLSCGTGPRATSNETKTETRRPGQQ